MFFFFFFFFFETQGGLEVINFPPGLTPLGNALRLTMGRSSMTKKPPEGFEDEDDLSMLPMFVEKVGWLGVLLVGVVGGWRCLAFEK